MRILFTGASGSIGSSLIRVLRANSMHTVQMVRQRGGTQAPEPDVVLWRPESEEVVTDHTLLEGADAAIHLSGANVAGRRWSEAYKREIVSSRVDTTRALLRLFKTFKTPPKVLLSASAIGFYGNRDNEILDETSASGSGFLAETCRLWEGAAEEAESMGIRTVFLRFGVVLDPAHGALASMLPLFRLGLGGRLGSGGQWMSWISITDVPRVVLHLLSDPSIHGAVNVCAPHPVRNADFTRALGRALHRPAVLPAPAFALRLAIGEMAQESLLSSARVLPRRLLDSGFAFEHATIDSALKALLR